MTHIAFPMRAGPLGRTETVDGADYLKLLIEQVLFTRPGERVMRPEFGGGAAGLVFAPNDSSLATATEVAIHAALNQALGELLEVSGVQVRADDATAAVTVRYAPHGGGPAEVVVFERKQR